MRHRLAESGVNQLQAECGSELWPLLQRNYQLGFAQQAFEQPPLPLSALLSQHATHTIFLPVDPTGEAPFDSLGKKLHGPANRSQQHQ